MTEAYEEVRTGEVTFAIKDSKGAHGGPNKAGDVIGIADGSIEAVGSSVEDVVMGVLDALEAEDADILTILAGIDFSDDELAALVEAIEERFEDLEVEAKRGDQPLYPIVLSVE